MSDEEKATPQPPAADPAPTTSTAGDAYNFVADKVGLVPNVRVKDNVVQALAVVIGMVVGALAGVIWAAVAAPGQGGAMAMGAVVGLVIGMIAGVFASGLALMIIGLRRKS